MSNIKAEITKKDGIEILTVSLPLTKRPSSSGKTTVIASTNGNHATTIQVDGKPVIIGLNAYIK